MQCDICQQETVSDLDQLKYQLAFQQRIDMVCQSCKAKFDLITGPTCQGCGRAVKGKKICSDCLSWQAKEGRALASRAIYHYNDTMAAFFTAYKFQSGYHLRYTFTKIIKQRLRALDYDVLVPVPVTIETLKRRGFDHVRGLLSSVEITPLLICSQTSKLSLVHQGRQARLEKSQPFTCNQKVQLSRTKRICVFDDVYTTGRTMHHAMMVLISQGYQHVQGLTLAR